MENEQLQNRKEGSDSESGEKGSAQSAQQRGTESVRVRMGMHSGRRGICKTKQIPKGEESSISILPAPVAIVEDEQGELVEEKIKITFHAYDRGKERLSLNKKSLARQAVKAYESGVKHKDTSGQIRKYLDKLWHNHKKANNVRLYGEYVFIFQFNLLITVFRMPQNLTKIMKHYR